MTYQYDSVNSSNYIGASGYRDQREHRCCKIPCLVLLPTILFALIVGHISTVAYIGSKHDVMIGSRPIHRIKATTKNDSRKAQKFAKEQFKDNLLEPCKSAEQFSHNDTKKGKGIMSTTGKDMVPPRPPDKGCIASILLFRHCEAGVAREHCGYMGNLRSQYIATLFGNSTNARWPKPDYIYAMKANERHKNYVNNWREIETVLPLSKKFNISIDDSFGYPERKKFILHLYEMLRTGEMCGKLAVISWKHHDMPAFSHSMGCGPEDGCPMTFGEFDYEAVWMLTYSYHKERYAPYAESSPHGISKPKSWGTFPRWFVYGTVQTEDFDPLVFRRENKQLLEDFDKNY